MRKSKNITKYTVEWQNARIRAKIEKDCTDKLSIVKEYFDDKPVYSRFERAYNWGEGLLRGYKDQVNKHKVMAFLIYLEDNKPEFSIKEGDHNDFNLIESKDSLCLYKDLYVRTKKWLKEGYAHQEQIAFLYGLQQNLNISIKRGYDIRDIDDLINNKPKNNYKFLFS